MIAFLDSDEIAKCSDLFFFKKRVWIFLEFMENGSFDRIILDGTSNYQEEFCRWSLYKVAKGIQAMHNRNVLHRDIKSDNLLSNMDGEIKIADLGLSAFLSQDQQKRTTR